MSERFFIGKSQLDEGEPAVFDGTIWAVPLEGDLQAWEAMGKEAPMPEPWCVAEHVPCEVMAEMIVRAINAHNELMIVCLYMLDILCMQDDPLFVLRHKEIIARATAALLTGQGARP